MAKIERIRRNGGRKVVVVNDGNIGAGLTLSVEIAFNGIISYVLGTWEGRENESQLSLINVTSGILVCFSTIKSYRIQDIHVSM